MEKVGVRERTAEFFDSMGQPGKAEQKTAKRFNRARALGLMAFKALTVVGALTVAGGARQEGFNGAIKAAYDATTSPLKNANGEWDIPFVDFNRDGNSVEVSTDSATVGVAVGAESAATAGQESAPAPSIAEGELPSNDSIICQGQFLDYTKNNKDYYYNKVANANPNLSGEQVALVVTDEGQMLNTTINVNFPPAGEQVTVPTLCK